MKTAITLLTLIFAFSFSASIHAQDKAELKFWKNKAKAYKKNPLSLKAEFENYQNQIKDLKRRNKEMAERLSDLEGGAPTAGPGKSLTDSLRWNLLQKEKELQTAKQDYAKLETAFRSVKRTNDMGIRPGLIYGVQIGAFVYHQMDNVPTDANDVIEEKSDGFNKYVIGNFRTYDEAQGFRNELRKIGLKDAWIVPYLDGVRVTMDEAKQYLQKQGNF
ncbi:MAG: hypothetical protein AB8F95_17865 [Bacteroidia bacterium]